MPTRMHEDEVDIDTDVVTRLIADQFPELGDEPLRLVESWGTDNAIWRVGDDLVVRLPRIHWASEQADKEAAVLPLLADQLTVTVPAPVAVGEPDDDYPYRWSLHRWLPGEPAGPESIDDPMALAEDLAQVVLELRAISAVGAPAALGRARPVQAYDDSTRRVIAAARDMVDVDAALAIWEEALSAKPHQGPDVWVHGDLDGNCIVTDGRLSGLVDWGSACAGDPAVDVQVVWSPLFDTASRAHFLGLVGADDATVARSRGAAVQQACAALPYYRHTYPLIVERSRHKLETLGVEVRGSTGPE